ncbi:MAG: phosphate/phosphite/phosphonate ABC transporter substrate-binding protein, partial [Burkholderiales bacterium]|nr:phosphate/phosphite/phosphonate ABC transporter substrate-binding protein [Burkholderiales bacterium]
MTWFTRRTVLLAWVGLACLVPLRLTATSIAPTNTLTHTTKPLVLGVFAFRPKTIIEERFAPLGAYLSTQLPGYTVKVVPMSNDELATGVMQGTVDFVLTNPTHYVQLRESNLLSGALATMVMRQGEQVLHGIGGVIIRRSERTDLRTLADLKHKRIAIAGKHFLGTYMAPAVELQRAGIDIHTLTWVETTQPVDQVITSVLAGKADAGFVRTGVLEDLIAEGKLNPTELAIVNPLTHPGYGFITSTRLYPEWPFLTVAHVDGAVSRLVANALFA